jgi:membrane associated rhomboid family serine protease
MGQGAGRVYLDFVLWAPAVADGEIYRLVTSGFLHDPSMPRGLLHIGFNMYLLWWLGNMLEPMLGHARFVALYFAALICGSFGALLLTPEKAALGASGAVFGLMAAAFVLQRARGIDPMQSGIGPLILFNLVLGFVIPNVSVGGHLGGLVGGALVALAFERVPSGRWRIPLSLTACAVIAVLAGAGAVLRATGVTG